MRFIVFMSVWIFLAGCIGTDFVDEPLAPPPSEAVIEESSLGLIAGEEYTLNYKLLANDGSEVPGTWEWSSRNEAVAIVDSVGTVTAIAEGQTWIDGIAVSQFRDSVLVTVVSNPNTVASITIDGETSGMQPGETRQLTAILRNIMGEVVQGDVDWVSSKPGVATVNDTGLVEALGEGTTNITASSGSISSVPFEIEVGQIVLTLTGTFSGRNGYNAQGTAVLSIVGDDATLFFEADFQTQNGPGLYIYLSPTDTGVTGAIELGQIQSTSGEQSYTIPGMVNPETHKYVIIYCKPFGVLFGVAELQE